MKSHPHIDLAAREAMLEAARVAAENVPTPFYLYDGDAILARYESLVHALPERVDVHYAVKANPRPEIVSLLATAGAGADVASAAELTLALESGVAPERITFAGPGKTDAEIALAVRHRIGLLVLESGRQVEQAAAVARHAAGQEDRDEPVRVGLRLNPVQGILGAGMAMGGNASALGVDEEQAGEVIEAIQACPELTLEGLHVFAGGQSLDAAALVEHYTSVVQLAARLASAHDLSLKQVVLGSGLGIPYFPKDRPLDLAALGAGLKCMAAGLDAGPGLRQARLALEPGRYLVGEAGIYVTRILDRKTSRGRTFLVADGGMHHHLVAAGGLGTVVRRNFPLVALPERAAGDEAKDRPPTIQGDADPADAPAPPAPAAAGGEAVIAGPGAASRETETVDLAGPLCHPLDRLGLGVELPRLEPGDRVAVLQSGAYGYTASPLLFLSRPLPREVWFRDGKVKPLPRRESSR